MATKTNPKYVLIAGTEEDKKEVAKLQAELEEEKKARTAAEDKEKDVTAKLSAMEDEDKVENAKKAIKAAFDDEKDEKVKATLKTAMEVFDTGNGVNTNAKKAETEDEKEKTAAIATLTAAAGKPLITKILKAKEIAGATESALKAETEKLNKLPFSALQAVYDSQEIFINKTLTAAYKVHDEQALVAAIESQVPFNGEFALTGKSIDLDEAMGHLQ